MILDGGLLLLRIYLYSYVHIISFDEPYYYYLLWLAFDRTISGLDVCVLTGTHVPLCFPQCYAVNRRRSTSSSPRLLSALPSDLARRVYQQIHTLSSSIISDGHVCVFSSHPFWTSSSLDVPAGVTQEEGHTGFLIHLPSAVRALIFVARRIQPFLSLVDREVEFCVLTN